MSHKFESVNKESKFYDSPEYYDKLYYAKIAKSNDEFGPKMMKILPKEGEIRLLGNRHKDCLYFSVGLDLCRKKVLSSERKSFLACKPIVDSMYRCYTNNAEGEEFHNIREDAKPYMNNFLNCIFKSDSNFDNCMSHFEDSIRSIYRSDKHGLIDYY